MNLMAIILETTLMLAIIGLVLSLVGLVFGLIWMLLKGKH